MAVPHKQVLMFVEVWLRGATEYGIIAHDLRGMRSTLCGQTRTTRRRRQACCSICRKARGSYHPHRPTDGPDADREALQGGQGEDQKGPGVRQDASVELSEDEEEEEIDYTEILQQQQREMEAKQEEKAKKMAEVKGENGEG